MNDYMKKRLEHKQFGKPKEEKKVNFLRKKSKKKIAEEKAEKELGGESSLDAWFKYHMEHALPVCMNCGMVAEWLKQPKYELMWRSSQAHILPKKKSQFPLQADNLNNHLVLFPSFGGHLCGCHGWFDSSWFNATTMDVWPKAVEIFKEKLYPVLNESERKKIPEQFLITPFQ